MLLDEVNEIRVILNRFRHAGLIALKFTWCTVHRATEIGSQTVEVLGWWKLFSPNCIGSFGLQSRENFLIQYSFKYKPGESLVTVS